MVGLHRVSVVEYHRLIQVGALTEDDNVELLEGHLVQKMSRNPPHDAAVQLLQEALTRALPAGWGVRVQSAVTLSTSEPEPDGAAARGTARAYAARHPGPADVGLVVEVADSSLSADRDDKGRIYARDGLPCYWIVNLVDQQVEVYTAPSGPADEPAYGQRLDYHLGDAVPLILDGVTVAAIPVADLLP